jgi:hypothetical protein
MTCPRCGNDYAVVRCAACNHAWSSNEIDSAELLKLVEKAETRSLRLAKEMSFSVPLDHQISITPHFYKRFVFAIRAFLSGNPSVLKKLAGV